MKYLSMNGYKRTEYLVYMSCWILLVAFAVISSWAMVQNHTLLMMKRILGSVCMFLLPLFVFFLIHNFLIAPLLVYKKEDMALLHIVSIVAFGICCISDGCKE